MLRKDEKTLQDPPQPFVRKTNARLKATLQLNFDLEAKGDAEYGDSKCCLAHLTKNRTTKIWNIGSNHLDAQAKPNSKPLQALKNMLDFREFDQTADLARIEAEWELFADIMFAPPDKKSQ